MESYGWRFKSSYPLVCSFICWGKLNGRAWTVNPRLRVRVPPPTWLGAHSLMVKRRQMTRVEVRGSNPLVRMYQTGSSFLGTPPLK